MICLLWASSSKAHLIVYKGAYRQIFCYLIPIFSKMLAHQVCIFSLFVSHISYIHLLSDVWALHQTELSFFQICRWYSSVLWYRSSQSCFHSLKSFGGLAPSLIACGSYIWGSTCGAWSMQLRSTVRPRGYSEYPLDLASACAHWQVRGMQAMC